MGFLMLAANAAGQSPSKASKLQSRDIVAKPPLSVLVMRHAEPIGGVLPTFDVPQMALGSASLIEALQLALEGSNLKVMHRSRSNSAIRPTFVRGVGGDLTGVMDKLAANLDFFWFIRGDVITIDTERDFVVDAINATDAEISAIEAVLKAAGASQVKSDTLTGKVSFTTGPRALNLARQRLINFAQHKSLSPLQIAFGSASESGNRSSASTAAIEASLPPKFWEISAADRTVEAVLRKWADQSDWHLRYEYNRIPVFRNSSVVATDFVDAVKKYQVRLVESGFDIDLTAIGNTMRVSPGKVN